MVSAPPQDFDQPAFNYIPPNCPYAGPAWIRQVDIPEVSKGKILLNSRASTHVSGALELFITREKLPEPRKLYLEVTDVESMLITGAP